MVKANQEPRGRPRLFNGIPLAWPIDGEDQFGFRPNLVSSEPKRTKPICCDADGHVLVGGPTGCGKTRSGIIPTLLSVAAPMVVLDIKGEIYPVTARFRREQLGHQIVCLDPAGLVTERTDAFNPLDAFPLSRLSPLAFAEQIASRLKVGTESTSDPFWHLQAGAIAAGCISHIVSSPDVQDKTLAGLYRWIFDDEFDLRVATTLDQTKTFPDQGTRDRFVSYLSIIGDKTRPCVLSQLQTFASSFGSREVLAATSKSTFDVLDFVAGRPMTIYIVVPPSQLDAWRPLLRLWVGALIDLILMRRHIPANRTIFLLDEVAQLGELEPLRTALTLCRGYGISVWMAIQNLGQLQRLYPNDFDTIRDNCTSLSVMGTSNYASAYAWGSLLGVPAAELLSLKHNELGLFTRGVGFQRCRKLDYLRDRVFEGRFDPNPFYRRHPVTQPAER